MRKQSENLLAILKSAVHHEALSLNEPWSMTASWNWHGSRVSFRLSEKCSARGPGVHSGEGV